MLASNNGEQHWKKMFIQCNGQQTTTIELAEETKTLDLALGVPIMLGLCSIHMYNYQCLNNYVI